MSKVIWKYVLKPINSVNTIELAVDAEILSVDEQNGQVFIWVALTPELNKFPRKFIIYATGDTIEFSPHKHIGTVKLNGGALILHVFEIWD